MSGWHWLAASLQALLLTILVLLRYDTYRDRRDWTLAQATKKALLLVPIIPIGFVVTLLVPLWLGWALLAVPAAIVLVMALAD